MSSKSLVWSLVVLLLMCGTWACSGASHSVILDDTDGDTDSTDTEETDSGDTDVVTDGDTENDGEHAEVAPALPVAQCAMTPYTLLSTTDVGELISFEELPLYNLTPEAINSLLTQYGLDSLAPVTYGSRLFRYRYSTQDKGVKLEATAMLSIPANVDVSDKSFPTALFLHGTTGFSDPCAPSASTTGPAEGALLASLGFITVLPDYIGLNGFGAASTTHHGYLVAEQTAIASWDALRAGRILLQQQLANDITSSGDVVVWGGSQGGHAALFTELYGPYYAPEFTVKAVVALVPPTDLKALVVSALTDKGPATYSLIPFVASQRLWYGAPANLNDVLTDTEPYHLASQIETLMFPQDDCSIGIDLSQEEQDALTIEDIYAEDFITKVQAKDWANLAPWDCYLTANSLATSPVTPLRHTPTLMVYANKDDLVVVDTQRPDFDNLCDQGYQLEFLECADAGHSDGGIWSFPEQLAFIDARLKGEAIATDRLCKKRAPECCQASPTDVCTP